jgi:mono/diheme cytochrome c family protein
MLLLSKNKLKKIPLVLVMVFLIFICSKILFAHSWMAPKEEAQKQNPISFNKASISNGKKIFREDCAHCHGENAKGRPSKSTGLKKDTSNLIQRLKNHTEGDFHWKIKNGKGEMPSFNEDLSVKEIWDVINFIKNLDK